MKNSVKIISLSIIMAFFSCSSESFIESETLDQSDAIKGAASKSTVHVSEKPGGFPDGVFLEVEGASSTIHRNKNGITVNLKTNGLIPGNAYTMWFVVIGETPGPPISSALGAGHIIGGSGKGNFSGHYSVGDNFDDPLTAEVHVVIRSHGAAQSGMIPSQIQTLLGGCVDALTFPQGPGRVWPDSNELGYCANVQLAIHY